MEIFLLLLLLLISLLSFLLFTRRSNSRARREQNLPPSPPKLPLIGNLHQLGKSPHRSLQSLAKKYGPDLMLMQLGQVQTLVVSSLDIVREITKQHDTVFSNRPKKTAAGIVLYNYTNVSFSPYGEYWRQVRKICVVELLSLRRVQLFQYVNDEETEIMIDRVRKACGDDSVKKNGFNLTESVISTSNNIISRCVIGKRFVEDDGRSTFADATRAIMNDLGAFSFGDYFPCLKWMDRVGGLIGRLKASHGALDKLFDQIIDERRANSNDDEGKADFIDVLLRIQKDTGLTQDNMKAILQDMFVAGTETTGTLLEWLMAELIKNPRIMKKAREEIRRVVGGKGNIEHNDINQMDYLKRVIKETLRLHPPLPFVLPRENSKSVEIGGYQIPAKTSILFNAYAIQRDERIWENPEEFLPDRFENRSVEYKLSHDLDLLAFGSGRRGCPGLAFGVSSTEFIIANLLYWFDWEIPENHGLKSREEDLDMTDTFGLSVCKKVPLYLVPKLYSP